MASKSTGASNDFKQATRLVKIMIEAGMSELGVVDKDTIPEKVLYEEMSIILRRIEAEVKIIIEKHKRIDRKDSRGTACPGKFLR